MRNPSTHASACAAPAAGLDRLGRRIEACLGLHFPESRQRDLLRAAEVLARDAGEKDLGAFLRSLAEAPLTDRQLELLGASLTVGETYFFREPKSLDAFRDRVLPDLIRLRAADRRLRIWSAGCSTGEEAYTVAMILADLIPDFEKWDVEILATDINRHALEKARQGLYTEWSFRNVTTQQRERLFKPQPGSTFAVRHRFREKVSFAYLNLASDVFPSLLNNTNAMDVIFCRNVLMYFVPELAESVVERFQHCLVEGGWLIVAPTESALIRASGLVPVPLAGATLYRKESATPAATPSGAAFSPASGREAKPADARHSALHSASRRASLYEEAQASYQKGRYSDAEATLKALLDADASEGRGITAGKIFALMARTLANQGKLSQAAEWARQATTANPASPGYLYLLAIILEEQHQLADAVHMLRRAICLDSQFILAHFALGHVALVEERRQEAARSFQNAAALLARLPKESVLAESDGLTAGRLLEIIEAMTLEEVPA